MHRSKVEHVTQVVGQFTHCPPAIVWPVLHPSIQNPDSALHVLFLQPDGQLNWHVDPYVPGLQSSQR